MNHARKYRVDAAVLADMERTDAAVSAAWRAVDTVSLMPADCLRQRHNRQALLEMRERIDAALHAPINPVRED
jgi:hypothetical protein